MLQPQVIDTNAFEVVVVSPRNHFVFTPMLPSTAVGTVEFRSAGGGASQCWVCSVTVLQIRLGRQQ